MTNETKRKLAAKFPSLIKYSSSLNEHLGNGFSWYDTNQSMAEREWEWVVTKIVNGLAEDNSLKGRVAYRNVLLRICGSFHAMLFATTEQKVQALLEIGVI